MCDDNLKIISKSRGCNGIIIIVINKEWKKGDVICINIF